MGPANARTTAVSPASGPDFEMPFLCGTTWTGSTRSGHSPSSYTIDFNAPDDLGKPVLASAPGVVTKAVSLTSSYGRYVVIDHGGGFTTLYAHLNQIATVVGTTVDQGDLIGYLGTSGNSTGPHLHFEQRKDGAYFPPYFNRARFPMGSTRASGNCMDRPVTGDWNNDRITDVGVFRTTATRGEWRLLNGGATTVFPWGYPGDTPLVGNWQGTRASEVAVRRQGKAQFLLRSPNAQMTTLNGLGYSTDIPITGDWDGNRISDLGFYRPATRQFWLRSPQGSYSSLVYGATGDTPVSGDWNGDGKTEVGAWRSSTGTFWMRTPSGSTVVNRTQAFGTPR